MQKSINALPQGFKISSYEIVEELGSGGFGITYKAYDSRLQTHVAIKEYLPVSFAVRESDTIHVAPRSNAVARDYKYGLDMFLREARTLARFRNERIIRVLQFLEANNTAYLVMEYEHGASLAAKIHDHSYSTVESQVLNLLVQILQGLAVVHDASILHRDIKPSNIYIRQDNSPVLLDFGSARFALSEQTMSLTSIVSPGYAPFEQYFTDGNQGPWTDFYALGATLYWVVTGKRPAEATERIIAVTGNDPDPNISAIEVARGRYSPLLLECIDWMLEPKVENRPQSSESILEHVKDLSQPMSTVISSPVSETETDVPSVRDRFSGNKTLLAGLALGLVTAVFAVAVYRFNDNPERPGKATNAQTETRTQEPSQPQAPESTWPGRTALQQPEQSLQRPDLPTQQPAQPVQSEQPSEQGFASFDGGAEKPVESVSSFQYYRQHRIDEMLKAGDLALADYRLTTPEEDSAAYYYRKALELSPQNRDAKAGLQRVVAAYIGLAEQKWRQGDSRTAREYLERASAVDPGNPEILAARRRMAASSPAHQETKPVTASPRRTLDPTSRYPTIRAAKIGYRNHEISKAEYARIRDILTLRYRNRITELKRLYREGKLSKYEYKRLARKAETDYEG